MRPLRLCIIGWGDHVHVERWAGYFGQRDDFDVTVLSLAGRGQYPAGVRQWCFPFTGRGPRWLLAWLRWMVWRLKPDIVHVHWAHFAAPVRASWRGPLVVTAWGSDIYRPERFDDAQWQALGSALRQSALVTCDSDDLASTIRNGFAVPADALHVVQWGVDTDMFSPHGPNLRAELGLADRPVVLSPRNFTSLYNQETVLRAFARLRLKHPRAFLLMKNYGGDPEYLRHIEALIADLGLGADVRILDKVDYAAMPALYRTANVTLSIPLSDAAPMSLLEAMACGSAAVVCDLPSLREWVIDGETGLLVPANAIDAVAGALDRLLSDDVLISRVSRQARTLVEERASQHSHMECMAGHYRALTRAPFAPVRTSTGSTGT